MFSRNGSDMGVVINVVLLLWLKGKAEDSADHDNAALITGYRCPVCSVGLDGELAAACGKCGATFTTPHGWQPVAIKSGESNNTKRKSAEAG